MENEIVETELDTDNLEIGESLTNNEIDELPGIPKEIADAWKEKYHTVFRIWFLGEQYIYRNFNYQEYSKLKKEIRVEFPNDLEASDEAFKERIQKLCVLWPADYYDRLNNPSKKPIPGGIPLLLGDYILVASGFSDSIVPDVIQK
jgi:hypothetical protein